MSQLILNTLAWNFYLIQHNVIALKANPDPSLLFVSENFQKLYVSPLF